MNAPTPENAASIPEMPAGIRVLYADAHILAVDKPAGIAAIPEGTDDRDSLRSRLEAALDAKLFVVHRLDKDVSGVIVFARDAETHRELNRLFTLRRVRKSYLALTHGVITQARGTISRPLREFGSGRMGVDPEAGKPSVTRYRVIERFAAYTLVEAQPITGRRHQLRVHLYAIGHPLAGDSRYGDRRRAAEFPRLMLHARSIRFALGDGPERRIDAPEPPAFTAVLEALRQNAAAPGATAAGAGAQPA